MAIIYLPIIHHELHHRICAFYTHTIDYRRRATPIGINSLVKTLKENEHADHENEASDVQDAEKNHITLFDPKFFDDSKFHPNKYIQTISNHCTYVMYTQ